MSQQPTETTAEERALANNGGKPLWGGSGWKPGKRPGEWFRHSERYGPLVHKGDRLLQLGGSLRSWNKDEWKIMDRQFKLKVAEDWAVAVGELDDTEEELAKVLRGEKGAVSKWLRDHQAWVDKHVMGTNKTLALKKWALDNRAFLVSQICRHIHHASRRGKSQWAEPRLEQSES